MPFVPVVKAADVPVGRGVFAEAAGIPLAVFNTGSTFRACGGLCPHEDGPLSEGWIEAGAALCPWHGFDFDLETGLCRVDPDLSVPVYRTRVVRDVVEVEVP